MEDKTLSMTEYSREDYIDYLICEMGYSKEYAEQTAELMYQ